MSIIISCIAIGLAKIVSSLSADKICVLSPTTATVKGIKGEYSYGGTDPIYEEQYWTKPAGSSCYPLDQNDPIYIRYSITSSKWQIADDLYDFDDYWYECSDCSRWDPAELNVHNNWYDYSGHMIQDFNIIIGECSPSHNETYLTITGYTGAYQGCNGEFEIVPGKKNLYNRTEPYDYDWQDENGHETYEPVAHYWLYNDVGQQWACDIVNVKEDYENSCRYDGYTTIDDSQMYFHN